MQDLRPFVRCPAWTSLAAPPARLQGAPGRRPTGGRMSWRRSTGIGVAVLSVAATATVAQAAPARVRPAYVQAGAGTVTVARPPDPATGDVDYVVAITGRMGVHGWSYIG